MKRAFLSFSILAVVIGLAADDGRTYYVSKQFDTSIYNSGYNIGFIGKSTSGLDWGILSYTYGIERFAITMGLNNGRSNMTGEYTKEFYDRWVSGWKLDDIHRINGSGVTLGRLILKYMPLSFGIDTKGAFKPLYFTLSPYLETSIVGISTRHELEWDENTYIGHLFPYFDLGLSLESSIFYARAGYTHAKKLGKNSTVQDPEEFGYANWSDYKT